jgi:hypothetical protein
MREKSKMMKKNESSKRFETHGPRVKIRILSFSPENPKKIRIFESKYKIRPSTRRSLPNNI